MVEKGIDVVKTCIESEAITAFGDTVNINVDRTKPHGKAVEVLNEVGLTLDQLRKFPRFSPYSLSEFDSGAPLHLDILPART